jgi:hypothetical protein
MCSLSYVEAEKKFYLNVEVGNLCVGDKEETEKRLDLISVCCGNIMLNPIILIHVYQK